MAQCARSTTIPPTCPALEVAFAPQRCSANDAMGWVVESRWPDRRRIGYVSHLNHLNPWRMTGDFGGGGLGHSSGSHFSRDLQACR